MDELLNLVKSQLQLRGKGDQRARSSLGRIPGSDSQKGPRMEPGPFTHARRVLAVLTYSGAGASK